MLSQNNSLTLKELGAHSGHTHGVPVHTPLCSVRQAHNRSQSLKKMKYFVIILLYFTVVSCQFDNPEDLPILKSELANDWRDYQFQNRTKLDMTVWSDLVQLDINNVTAICSIDIENDNKSKNHELFILNGISDNKEINLITTKEKDTNKILDIISFDPRKQVIYKIWGRSNKKMHDGFTIELVENRSTRKDIAFYSYEVWIFEDGEIEYYNPEFNSIVTFEYLPKTKSRVGVYKYQEDSLNIRLELRDGIIDSTYSFLFNYRMKNGCTSEVNNLKRKFDFVKTDTIDKYPIKFRDDEILISIGKEEVCEGFVNREISLNKNDTQ
jgi:hypothetical protein